MPNRVRGSFGRVARSGRSDEALNPHVAQREDITMRHFDLTPFYRSTVGFDRLFASLDQLVGGPDNGQTYPPYNIEKTGDNAYRVTLAVAGFGEEDLAIEAKENTLTIKGEKKETVEKDGEVLYRGIAARAFERRFQLADYVEVKGASLQNGLLHVDLVREIPEAAKPRQIKIANGVGNGKAKQVEAKVAA
jgi:molecular chaperone IbpA